MMDKVSDLMERAWSGWPRNWREWGSDKSLDFKHKYYKGITVSYPLPHKVDIPDSEGCLCACPWAERLFPCGDGICVQNYETKKIEILVDE